MENVDLQGSDSHEDASDGTFGALATPTPPSTVQVLSVHAVIAVECDFECNPGPLCGWAPGA